MKANASVLVAAAGLSALLLSGCSSSAGGDVAATVDGTTVSKDDVTFLAELQCDGINDAAKDPAQAGAVQAISRKQLRASMVNALVQAELNRELAEEQKVTYDRDTYRQIMDQFEQTAQTAPKEDRARFRELVGNLYKGQLEIYALAARELSAQGVEQPSQEQVEGLVSQLQEEYRAKADIDIDPVYGVGKDGLAGSADTSLSKPLSSFAKSSVTSPEDPSWVGDLPANQKCG